MTRLLHVLPSARAYSLPYSDDLTLAHRFDSGEVRRRCVPVQQHCKLHRSLGQRVAAGRRDAAGRGGGAVDNQP
ncbi:hypothetical protein E2C01_101202 [Portunus trituberculatus]|uniref:Uncharacterized protein n=1 Tax=Portunus trituberculatus TaxID=210409 RepID=A0A5B7KFI8_PORTR|nr:hypothetical protein [Portunus trituberculatus]